MVQEYGGHFEMNTVSFRGGLTGPNTLAQGYMVLSYLMKCAITKKDYTIFGYGGKQVVIIYTLKIL